MGHGAFGAVYLGYDTQLDRQVAIKAPLLRARELSKPDVEESFLQEARQLAQLTHPNIVTVYDVGVDDGVCYIVSDYLDPALATVPRICSVHMGNWATRR